MAFGTDYQGVAPDGSIPGIITAAANRYGVDPAYLQQAAAIESRNNPSAVSPTGAKGLFQFTDGTAKQYGLRNPYDPAQNADAAARLTRDNQTKLTTALGRQPTPGELYLAHQQGAGGAIALLTHPTMNAVDALAPVYGGSRGRAQQALTVNGGSPTMTAGAFANQWASRLQSPTKMPTLVASAGNNAPSNTGTIAPLGINAQPNAQPNAQVQQPFRPIGLGTGFQQQPMMGAGLAAYVPRAPLSDTPAMGPDPNLWLTQNPSA